MALSEVNHLLRNFVCPRQVGEIPVSYRVSFQVHLRFFGAPCEGTVSQRVQISPDKGAPAGSNRSSRGGNEAAEASW